MTLDEIRKKWPTANYAPRKGCRYCDGTGESKTHPGLPCVCIYVDHEMCDFAAESLAETARALRKEMNL